MKRYTLSLIISVLTISLAWGANLISENIQSWTPRGSYGSYTQEIPVNGSTGTVSMTRCMVSPGAALSGTGSMGRVQMEATNGILELPQTSSAGAIELHLAAGSTDRSVKLQSWDGSAWIELTTFSGINTIGSTHIYNLNNPSATRLRLASPSHALYVHDIIVTDFQGLGIPTVTTATISSITAASAISGGNVTADGGSIVTAKGVCWATSPNPTISGNHSNDGSGTGSFVSTISGLAAQTLYYVRAYATNSQGTAYGEELSFTTSGTDPPAIPTATAATAITASSFVANWNPAVGASSYRLDVSTSSIFASFVSGYNNLTVSNTSQTVSGLSPATTYYYRVRSVNVNGTSASSNVIQLTTVASDPYNGYYNPVLGLTGTTLKNGLHDLIDNNTYSNYDGAKTFLFQSLDNTNGVVRCVYTGQDYSISSSYNGSSNPNTEHSYAQSWFDGTAESSIKKADVHHLFITNSSVNSSRSNYPFDDVEDVTATYPSYNGYVSLKGTNQSGDTVFEPADQHKGNLARAMLYFSVRYNMTLSQGGVDMLDTFITWHSQDPVDSAELARNAAVYNHQGNRNPFVDHPEYVSYIWGGTTPNTIVQFSPASAMVDEDEGTVTLTVTITNPSPTSATTAQIVLSSGNPADIGNYSTQNISFPAGSSSNRTITVNITDDGLLEGTEILIFSLVNVSGGNSASAGSYSSFNLEILDNDIPTVVATAPMNVGYYDFMATWQPAPGITDYYFDLSTDTGFTSFVTGYEDYPCTGNSLYLMGLDDNTTYYYRLRAVYNDSPGAYSNVIFVTTDEVIILDPPLAYEATAVSHEGFTARWSELYGAESYYLEVFSAGSAFASDLIISEYVEGSSNNKYIEIYNGTGNTIDLSSYAIRLYSNGASSPSSTSNLSGSLAHGQAIVYKNSAATLTLPAGVTAVTLSAINFNGDDAVELFKSSTGTTIDIFGRIGEDPGTAWTADSYSTLDKTLRRKPEVLAGITTNPGSGFPTLVSQWDVYPIDTADGLGTHQIAGGSILPGYENYALSNTVSRISGLDPESSYSYRIRASNIGGTSEYSDLIQVQTTGVIPGSGANTSIAGASILIEAADLPGYTDNTVTIDPISSPDTDFAVLVSTITDGIRYTINASESSSFAGNYTLRYNGLGFVPAYLAYSLGTTTGSYTGSFGSTETSLNIPAGSGTLVIDILREDPTIPPVLDSPVVVISYSAGQISLTWSPITHATSYLIEASDNPITGFSQIGQTSTTNWTDSALSKRFYRVKALNE
jgi:hypothetical protein